MKVGMTYDLRDDYLAEGYTAEETAEFDHPRTIAAIEEALQSLGCETDRIGHIRTLTRRLAAHNAGEGAKYTRGRIPVSVVYRESCADKSAALKREIQIKRLSRSAKQALLQGV